MASFLDVCRFTAASSGTGSFVVSAAVTGYQTPASANAVSGATYRYRAESADLTQWEVGYGVYTSGSVTLTRATILFNSSGGASAINFSSAPTVAVVALAEDLTPTDGYLNGLTLSNNVADATNDIDIASGSAADSTGNIIMRFASSITKRLDAGWVAGTNQGFRNSAVAITDTTYHIYAVSKASGADPDYYAHTSATVATVITALQAESGGSSYIHARRIGSILRVSGAIRPFWQTGDLFQYRTQFTDRNSTSAAAWALLTLSVPLGIEVQPLVTCFTKQNTAGSSDTALGDARDSGKTSPVAMGAVAAAGETAYNYLAGTIFTNTSGQIYHELVITSGTLSFGVTQTRGYYDTRGRL